MNRQRFSARLVPLALGLTIVTGCGATSETPDETTPPDLEPPEAKESISEAERRIAKTVSSDDCDAINELNPLSRPQLRTDRRCDYLKRIDGLDVLAAEDYGNLGGVIDYRRGAGVISAVLIRDSDGLFHVAFLDAFRGEPSAGTKAPPEFDRAADRAVKALEDGDCEAFLEVASRRFGAGVGSDSKVCNRIENSRVAAAREASPDAELEPLGGNGGYAFYGLASPGAYLVIVTAQQVESDATDRLSSEIADLPEGASEHAYVDAYRANTRREGQPRP